MGEWWEALSTLQKILASAAIPATIVLVLQTLLLLFGIGHDHDSDGFDHDGADCDCADMEGDGVPDHDFGDHSGHDHDGGADGLRFFTVKGLVAFFAIGGWFGIFLAEQGVNEVISILGAVIIGSAATVLVALFMKMALKLQGKGNLVIENAIGKTGTVYLTIPANSERTGKITMELQERFVELEALTKKSSPIKTGKFVKVVDVINGSTLVVEEIENNN